MARVIVSSSALHTQLGAHLGAATVQLRIGGGMCSLWSEEFTNAVPCESWWTGTATVGLEKLLAALAQVADQPIALDLHAEGTNRLYACQPLPAPAFGYTPLTFDL